MVKVNVKWGKQRYEAVDLDPTEPLVTFKMVLWSLTGVPPERQKILGIKGGPATDETVIADREAKFHVKDGQQLMLMGTADAVPEAPKEKTVFIEDIAAEKGDELAEAMMASQPSGLENLGNTCYLNSAIHFLRSSNELKEAIENPPRPPNPSDPRGRVVSELSTLFRQLDTSKGPPIVPGSFVQSFRTAFPQFAQTTPQGFFAQQDAQECMTQLLHCVKAETGGGSAGPSPVERLLEGEMESRITCADAGDADAPEVRRDTFSHLTCHITNTTNHLHEGLERGLEEDIVKRNASLGRDADHHKVSRISRLPQYINVHFVRFFWKAKDGVKAKILRAVKFPMQLDVFNLCTEGLRGEMAETRRRLQEIQDRAMGHGAAKTAESGGGDASKDGDGGGGGDGGGADAMEVDTTPVTGRAALGEEDLALLASLEDCDTGFYDLCAVLTHQGRQADGGHYVGWAKGDDGEWRKYDDDVVTDATPEEVLDLCGGGDRAMAYMCLYRRKSDHIQEPKKDDKGKGKA